MPSTPDVERIAGPALLALGDHLNDIDKYAPAAARRYVAALLAGKSGTPHTSELHPLADRLLRECVLDELSLNRRGAA
jgi:hypothetical protein